MSKKTDSKPAKKSLTQLRKERKLSNFSVCGAFKLSMGRMFGVDTAGREIPVCVIRDTKKGTQSHASASDEDKVLPNLQAVDSAFLPPGCDKVRVRFSLMVDRTDGYGMASCMLLDTHQLIEQLHQRYAGLGGYLLLAQLYVGQLANGAFLWHNKYGKDREIVVTVEGTNYNLAMADERAAVEQLVADALAGKLTLLATVTGTVTRTLESPVYPSEELVTNKAKGEGRILAKDENGHALMHSQKLGNALRRIDIWHPGFADVGALPIEPFGTASDLLEAYRRDERSFYKYLDDLAVRMLDSKVAGAILGSNSVAELEDKPAGKDVHYFMAMLIRGGVFGVSSSDSAELAKDPD